MKKILMLSTLAVIFINSSANAGLFSSNKFKLTSNDIKDGSYIDKSFEFNGFGCNGNNESPNLSWANAPEGTKGFAVTIHDPDAPTGGAGFWHWVVVNIPANINSLEKNAGKDTDKNTVKPSQLPEEAISLRNDYGYYGFGGFCPPSGEKHKYVFTVYALKSTLEVNNETPTSLAGFLINANAIDKASFKAKYKR